MAKQKVAIEIEVIRGGNTKATINSISQLELELAKLNKQLREAKKQGDTATYTKVRGETAKLKSELSQANRELTQQQKDFRALSFAPGSYHAISAEVSKLKREFQGLGKEAREGIAGNQIRQRIASLTGELKKIDAGVGVFTRNVGNYASAFRGLVPILGAVGIGFGITELVQQAQLATKTFADFQQEIKTLQAISGASGEELAALERNARRLGETTQFTALEVAKLQTNFARIGLTAPEILAATEATTNLAIATTENVERASEVMGAAINGFSLGADQAGRIGDVMTEAFNRTALSLDKWAEAQKFAATVATSAGVSIEGTAASMGILADAGLEGSSIGTVLRRIFSDLSTEGSKLAKEIGFVVKDTDDFTLAMQKLSEAGIDNSKAFQLVGRYAQSGLIALVNRADDISGLTTALEGASGAAARTAAIVGDTLAQDMLKAKSAIEGLRINLVSTANEGLRNVVQGFTSLVDLVSRFVAVPVSEQLEAERIELNNLVTALELNNDNEEVRSRLISEISAKYPEFLKQVNIETASNEELQVALQKVNNQYLARITLQKLAEDVEEKALTLQKRQTEQGNTQINQAKALAKARQFLGDQSLTIAQAQAKLDAHAQTRFVRGQVVQNEAAKIAGELEAFTNALARSKVNEAKATDQLTAAEAKRTETLATIRELNPEIAAQLDAIAAEQAKLEEGTKKTTNTVADLNAELADLLEQRSETPEDSQEYEDLSERITEVRKQLGLTTKEVKSFQEVIAPGSLKALQKELTDLNAELENTPVGGQKFVEVARRIQTAQERLNEALKQKELLTFDIADFVGDPADIERNVKALEDALKFEESVKQLKIEASVVDVDAAQDAIQRLEAQRIISLQKQLRAGIITEEQYNREKERIAQQTELAILESRLSAFEVGSTEYLQVVQDIADKEIAIEREKNAKIEEDGKQRRQAILNYAFQAADDIANAIVQVEENKVQRELDANIAALEEQYEKRLALAEGNTEAQGELQKELDAKKAELEKQAAQRRKEIAKKEAIINTALAVTNVIATTPGGFTNPLLFVALAAQAIALAAQIAAIESQQFARGGRISDNERKAKGGKVRGRSHDQGGEHFTVRSTGQRVELEGGEGVVNKRSMRSRDVLSLTGTPSEIISSVNAYKGYGIPFEGRRIQPRIVKRVPFFQTGGEVPASPQFVNPNQVFGQNGMSMELVITNEQIDRIADRIAAKTAKETGQAVEVGMDNANRRKDRNTFVQNKTGIR